MYQDIVYEVSIYDLMHKYKRLVPERHYTTKEAKNFRANLSAGQETMFQQQNKTFGNALTWYEKHARGRKAILGAPSVEQCFYRAREFSAAGWRVGVAVGAMSNTPEFVQQWYREERYTNDLSNNEIERLRDSEIDILMSVHKITAGLDIPDIIEWISYCIQTFNER